MQDVAADRDAQPLDPALAAADGEGVEKRLGRMLVGTVAGVDDRTAHVSREQATAPLSWWRTTSTSGCMALSVIAVSISVSPFFMAELATAMLTTSAPSRLPASSKLVWVRVEALEEEVDLGQPLQELQLLVGPSVEVDEAVRAVQEVLDLEGLQPLDAEQVVLAKAQGCGVRRHRGRTMQCRTLPGKAAPRHSPFRFGAPSALGYQAGQRHPLALEGRRFMRRPRHLIGSLAVMALASSAAVAAEPENTLLIELQSGQIVVELLPEVAPEARRQGQAAGARRLL